MYVPVHTQGSQGGPTPNQYSQGQVGMSDKNTGNNIRPFNSLNGQTLADKDVPSAQDIINQITGLKPDDQLRKLNELAVLYNVDLKKIMGVNVAFDISDNTDDIEPPMMINSKKFGPTIDVMPDKDRLGLTGNLSGVTNNRYS